MYVKQYPVNLNSVSTGTALVAHDQELTAVYAEHQSVATDFAGAAAPQLPVTNCRWLDTSTTPPILKRWNGSSWVTEYIDHAVNADNATNAGNAATATKLETARKINGIPFDGSADINGALSFRNKLINGNFGINQEAKTGTVTLSAGVYGHDMWKAGLSGCTYTFSTVANVTTITITAGSLLQIIEGINLQSGTHVLSWQGTAQGKINSGSYGASGVTGTATGGTNLNVEFGTGTLSNVQLECGQVATQFERKPLLLEKMLCQQYFITSYSQGEIIGGSSDYDYSCISMYNNSGSTVYYLGSNISLPVQMRANPTITLYSSHNGANGYGWAQNSAANVPIRCTSSTLTHFIVEVNASAVIAGDIVKFHYTVDARL